MLKFNHGVFQIIHVAKSGGIQMISNGQQCSNLPSLHYQISFIQRPSFKLFAHYIVLVPQLHVLEKSYQWVVLAIQEQRRCIHGSCRGRDDMEHLNSYEQGLEKRCHLVHIIGTFLLNQEMTCISIPMRRDQKRDVIWFISQELFY